MRKILSFLLIGLSAQSCFLFDNVGPKYVNDDTSADSLPEFIATPQFFEVSNGNASEASGMAAANNFENCVWVQEDGNNEAGIHLLSKDGVYKKFVKIGIQNRDWEDMASGVGPTQGKNYIYIADIGDNNLKSDEYYVYRFLEPTPESDEIVEFNKITFTYPGRISLNAETLLLDPLTKDIYIVSKDAFNVSVYRLPYPQSTTSTMEAENLGTIPYWLIVGGDISKDGKEILLKTYASVLYWKRKPNESIYQALLRVRDVGAPYIQENQGEAICWDKNTKGYFTISENLDSRQVQKLYYYPKK